MLDGRPTITGATPTLIINGSSYGGGDGCNSGGGRSDDGPPVVKPDGSISFDFSSYGQTLKLCDEGVMEQADRYQSALMDARRYEVRDERLVIMDEGGVVRMVFSPRPVLPGVSESLVDTTWRFLPGESEVGGDESFILSFLDPDLALAETSCGNYVIHHGTDDGSRIRFQRWSQVVESKSHCPTDHGYGQDPSLQHLGRLRQFAVQRGGEAPRLMMQTYLGKFAAFEPVHRDTVGIFDGEWTLWRFGELEVNYPDIILAMDISPVVSGTKITARFRPAGIEGETFCGPYDYVNPWETMISADGQIATLGLPPHERNNCSDAPGVSEQEELYFDILSRLKTYRASQGYLIVYDRDDRLLIFKSRED